jgi:hypothetical protein
MLEKVVSSSIDWPRYPHNWPLRSPDLTPLDSHVWGRESKVVVVAWHLFLSCVAQDSSHVHNITHTQFGTIFSLNTDNAKRCYQAPETEYVQLQCGYFRTVLVTKHCVSAMWDQYKVGPSSATPRDGARGQRRGNMEKRQSQSAGHCLSGVDSYYPFWIYLTLII